jgi:hypothetical protein
MRATRFAAAVHALVLGAVALGALACARQGKGATEEAPHDPGATLRFPHAQEAHATLACVECHAARDVEEGRPARPGTQDHAPCDRGRCHREAFEGKPVRLCQLCHSRLEPWRAQGTRPAPFPPQKGVRALAAEFSHAVHLDARRIERKVGFHVSCGDCHRRESGTDDPELPSHATCQRCHGDAGALAVKMSDCTSCHVTRRADPPRARQLIQGDLRFRHAAHEADRRGKAIPCVTCHDKVARLRNTDQRSLPQTSTCVSCHDDETRTPASLAMAICSTCHNREIFALARIVAPRSHLAAQSRPDDHTLLFRRNHAAEAEREAARCARCHTSVSGEGQDACHQCHDVMRPRDHRVSWRDYEHGPQAAATAERCGVCHQEDFCTSCHAQRPRSHGQSFLQVHQVRVLRDARSCQVCHDVLVECRGCHTEGSPP